MKPAFAFLVGALLVSGFTSAHAKIAMNGTMNGISLNGIALNGWQNGVGLNGLALNGWHNGVSLNGQNLNTADNGSSVIKLVGIILPEDEK